MEGFPPWIAYEIVCEYFFLLWSPPLCSATDLLSNAVSYVKPHQIHFLATPNIHHQKNYNNDCHSVIAWIFVLSSVDADLFISAQSAAFILLKL